MNHLNKKTCFFLFLVIVTGVLGFFELRALASEENAALQHQEAEKPVDALHGEAADHEDHAQAEHGHAEHHVPSVREIAVPLAFRFINFFIFIGVLVFFLRKPIAQFLANRRQTISDIIEQSAERKEWANKKYQEYHSRLDRIDEEIEALKNSLRREGEREREEMLREAEQLAQSIKKDALLVADAELVDLRRELRDQAVESAALAAKETLLRLKDESDEKRLADELISQLGRGEA